MEWPLGKLWVRPVLDDVGPLPIDHFLESEAQQQSAERRHAEQDQRVVLFFEDEIACDGECDECQNRDAAERRDVAADFVQPVGRFESADRPHGPFVGALGVALVDVVQQLDESPGPADHDQDRQEHVQINVSRPIPDPLQSAHGETLTKKPRPAKDLAAKTRKPGSHICTAIATGVYWPKTSRWAGRSRHVTGPVY
jgi:hypothetical protein